MARIKSLVPVLGGPYHQSTVLQHCPLVVGFQRPDVLEEPLNGIGVLEGAVKHRRFAALRDQVPGNDLYRGGIVTRDDQGEAFHFRRRSSLVLRQAAVHSAVLGYGTVNVQLLLLDLDPIAPYHRFAVSENRVRSLLSKARREESAAMDFPSIEVVARSRARAYTLGARGSTRRRREEGYKLARARRKVKSTG